MNKQQPLFVPSNLGLLSGLLAVIIILPWFHGGEINWQYKIFESALFLMFAYFCMKAIKTNSLILLLKPLQKFKLPILLLLSFCLYSFFQAVDLNTIFDFNQKTNDSSFVEKKIR
ncbi:hypothetical protein [Pseudocolwellia sp. HL-MZ7]|uniref:hypothetical protein n=1 Tax=Pseudocolwellia sp. HL-MZ7 TaxID=3400627 RepID=UPI003CEDEE32